MGETRYSTHFPCNAVSVATATRLRFDGRATCVRLALDERNHARKSNCSRVAVVAAA